MIYGETLNFSLDKQMERVVEVLALSALLQASTEQIIKNREAVKRLKEIAFPLENIQLEEIGYCGCAFCITNKREGKKYNMHMVEK